MLIYKADSPVEANCMEKTSFLSSVEALVSLNYCFLGGAFKSPAGSFAEGIWPHSDKMLWIWHQILFCGEVSSFGGLVECEITSSLLLFSAPLWPRLLSCHPWGHIDLFGIIVKIILTIMDTLNLKTLILKQSEKFLLV